MNTREALLLVLDHVDYEKGACRVNEPIGGVLPVEVLHLAKESLERPVIANRLVPPMDEAKRIYSDYLKDEVYPEDAWIAIGDWWDVNLYTKDDQKLATLYPVKDDETDTSRPYPVTL